MGSVPTHLMDSNRDAEGFGHGEGYKYPHDYPGHFIPQQYLPGEYDGMRFYEPSGEGYEREIGDRLNEWRQIFRKVAEPKASKREQDPEKRNQSGGNHDSQH
jgi:putative ATPase